MVRLIEGGPAREVLFHRDERQLADALRHLEETAHRAALGYMAWDRFRDERITGFLQRHPPRAA